MRVRARACTARLALLPRLGGVLIRETPLIPEQLLARLVRPGGVEQRDVAREAPPGTAAYWLRKEARDCGGVPSRGGGVDGRWIDKERALLESSTPESTESSSLNDGEDSSWRSVAAMDMDRAAASGPSAAGSSCASYRKA
jgi:hypothetical protein